MSPAPKTKKSTKPSQKPPQNTQNPSSSSSSSSSTSNSNAYNPVSGTFHTLETPTLPLTPLKFPQLAPNSEDQTIPPNSPNSLNSPNSSNSISGESEDTNNPNTNATNNPNNYRNATGGVLESEKREKIRLKNEKKHQRQRERRAQELHERCSGYLMSRKLELLSQQLVAMGFTQEQSTMALIQNEGKVEESVAWLFEGGEESRKPEAEQLDLNCGVGLKIEIAEELQRIAEYEVKYNCTKQEVERAVVNCEGDLNKTEEVLKALKQEISAQVKSEEVPANQRPPPSGKGVSVGSNVQKKGERDFNYVRSAQESVNNNNINNNSNSNKQVQVLERPVNPLSSKQPQQLVLEKRWQGGAQNPSLQNPSLQNTSFQNPSLYQSAASSSSNVGLQNPNLQVKHEQHYPVPASVMKGSVVNSVAVGVTGQMNNPLREQQQVVVMQRPQQTLNPNSSNNNNISSNNLKQNMPSTSLGLGFHSNGSVPGYPDNSKMYLMNRGVQNLNLGRNNAPANGVMTGGMQHYSSQNHADVPIGNSWLNGSGLTSPSSLGLFTGWGPSRTPNNNNAYNNNNATDWNNNNNNNINNNNNNNSSSNNNGGYNPCDYTSIDWSLDLTLLNTSNGNNNNNSTGTGTGLSETWSTMFMGRTGTGIGNPMRKGGTGMGIGTGTGISTGTVNESRFNDWTTPFSGEDILGASRKYVMSPFLKNNNSRGFE